jgi:hypothetical protein
MSEQHTVIERSRVTTENSQIWPRTRIAESVNVKVQNVCHGRKNYVCAVESSLRIFAKLCTLETRFVSGV